MRCSSTLLAAIALIFGGTDVAAAREGAACTPAPRTGCLGSDEVELRVSRSPERVDWSWHGAVPGTDGDFGLCVYDGERTTQTEAAAPAPHTDSLILGVRVSSIEADDGKLLAEVVADVSWLERLFGGGEIGLATLDSVDGSRIISQLQRGEDLCFGKSISIAYANGPPFPESGSGVMDAEKGKRLLDELAAEHNAEQGGRALSMMR